MVECLANGRRGGFGIDGGNELPEVERVAEVLVRARWELGMEGNDGRTVPREVLGDGVFPSKPLAALARAVEVGHHARDESFREAQHQRAAVLQDLATVRRDAVSNRGFRCGTDGKIEGGHGEFSGMVQCLNKTA